MAVEEDLHSLRNVSFVYENLKALDVSVQQILKKINLNQESISDLSKYFIMDKSRKNINILK